MTRRRLLLVLITVLCVGALMFLGIVAHLEYVDRHEGYLCCRPNTGFACRSCPRIDPDTLSRASPLWLRILSYIDYLRYGR